MGYKDCGVYGLQRCGVWVTKCEVWVTKMWRMAGLHVFRLGCVIGQSMVVEYGVEVLFLSPSSQIDELTMNVNEISLLVEKIQQNHTVVLASIQNRGTSF